MKAFGNGKAALLEILGLLQFTAHYRSPKEATGTLDRDRDADDFEVLIGVETAQTRHD